jgi:hypothetical protein
VYVFSPIESTLFICKFEFTREVFYHFEPHSQPFLALVIFGVVSCGFAQGWPQTMILLPVASYAAGIIGVSYHTWKKIFLRKGFF